MNQVCGYMQIFLSISIYLYLSIYLSISLSLSLSIPLSLSLSLLYRWFWSWPHVATSVTDIFLKSRLVFGDWGPIFGPFLARDPRCAICFHRQQHQGGVCISFVLWWTLQGGAPPVISWYKLVYNPNNYRYNPLINPSYNTYKPT